MASSDNLPSFEPWVLRSAFPADPWLSDSFARDADALTKALSFSLSAPSPSNDSLVDLLPRSSSSSYPATPRSLSDPDTAPASKKRPPAPAPARAAKRKSRASKKSPTTFITADPENFRHMVQQVTGIQFSGVAPSGLASILRPAPQRFAASTALGGRIPGLLPTLDTSAFLLDHHQDTVGAPAAPSGEIAPESGADGGLDFGSFSCFPTLDSWEVM